MTLNLNLLPKYRSHQLLKPVQEISSLCWPGSVTEGVLSAPRGWLRRFLLLKMVSVLLFPRGTGIALLVGSFFSLRALFLIHSPRVSTKPSTVFLGQLALSDSLVVLQWVLWLGLTLAQWVEDVSFDVEMDLVVKRESLWWSEEAVNVLCQQLLDAHHLASLLLLGLLGLEATLVSRWPQQTRSLRTSHWAQLSCNLVWILVLFELMLSLHSKLSHGSRPQNYTSTLQDSQASCTGLAPPSSLSVFSPCLRRTLWLLNLWLHYAVFYTKPQQRKSSFH